MNTNLTRDRLKIFWHGEEASGLTVYAYATPHGTQAVFPMGLWPDDSLVKASTLSGDDWLVFVWDLRVRAWPGEWKSALRSTLVGLCGPSASVVWCGLEGCFADPPDLLSPVAMADCVYAASSADTGFICHTDIDDPFKALHDEELRSLKAQTTPR